MKTAIFYLTRDGQTQKIAEYIAQHLTADQTTVLSLREHNKMTSEALAEFDNIVIGASIRYGHFDPILEQFISRHNSLLNLKRSAFFSVNLTARKGNRNTPESNTYTRKLLQRIQWQPTIVEVFAGALLYPRYRWFDRIMIRFIMQITGGETDTRFEYEYTDWDKVKNFAKRLANEI